MVLLAERWPQSIHFPRLLSAARAKINPNPVVLDSDAAKSEERMLTEPLLRCYATTVVDLNIGQFPFAQQCSARPVAMRLARYEAARGNPTTNLWHETVRLSDIQRRILLLLDGNHERDSLIDMLAGDVQSSKLVVHDKGEPVSEPSRVREILSTLVDDNLKQLARNGFLTLEASR
jgi:hypothetical protein